MGVWVGGWMEKEREEGRGEKGGGVSVSVNISERS
jgi:hypothetical protein